MLVDFAAGRPTSDRPDEPPRPPRRRRSERIYLPAQRRNSCMDSCYRWGDDDESKEI